jgi:diguanylate cyclase (GGDEF)-like protein
MGIDTTSDQEYEFMQEAIANASGLFDNYEKKILDQKNLLKISGIINSTLSMQEMNEALLFSCQGTVLVTNISIFLIESVITYVFAHRSSVGLNEEPPPIRIEAADPLVGRLAGKENCVFVSTLAGQAEYAPCLALPAPIQPHLLIPMRFKEDLMGFMVFGEKLSLLPFTSTEIEFLNNVASFAAIAAENIRLFEMATLDRMTNLFIHHYFQNRLEEEIVRAIRYENPLSILMFDIDHFKTVNDTHGHQAGDAIIKSIAGLIRSSLRKLDLPARYGGEEFAIILPESTRRKALQVGERIRSAVAAAPFDIGNGQTLQVTVSGGICELEQVLNRADDAPPSLPPDPGIKERLIRGADTALYDSKHGGRNRISLFSDN